MQKQAVGCLMSPDTAYTRYKDGEYKHYNTSIVELIFEGDVRAMYKACKLEEHRTLLSLIWHTAARPSEIIEIKARDVEWGLDQRGGQYFAIRVCTKKLGDDGKFKIVERTLQSTRPLGMDSNIYVEQIIHWVKNLLPDEYVLPNIRTIRRLNHVMHAISKPIGKDWAPYHWRHSTMTHLARSGLGLTQLQYWKGAKTIHSVSMYLHAVPAYIAIENIRKERERLVNVGGGATKRGESNGVGNES